MNWWYVLWNFQTFLKERICFYNHDDLRLYQSKYFYSYDDLRQILSLPSLSKVDFFCRSINLVLPLHPHTCTTTLFTTFTCVHYIFRQKSFNFGNDLVNITSTMLSRTIWLVGFLYFVISLQYSNVQYLMFL